MKPTRLSVPVPPALHRRAKVAAAMRSEPLAMLVLRGLGRELHALERHQQPPVGPEVTSHDAEQ